MCKSQITRPLVVAIALIALAVGASAAAAATINIASDTAETSAYFQKHYGMTFDCPDTITIGKAFTCTYSKGGATSSAAYIIHKQGQQVVPVDPAAAAKALNILFPLSFWIATSVKAYNKPGSMDGVTVSCPKSASSAASVLSCTLTSKDGKRTATVDMRFKPLSHLGYAVVPVKQSRFNSALMAVS